MDIEFFLLTWGQLIIGSAILAAAIHHFTKPIKMPLYDTDQFTEKQLKILSHWEEDEKQILEPRQDAEGNLYFIMPTIYNWAIVCGVEYWSYKHRFCYPTLRECISAYDDWTPDLHTKPNKFIVQKGGLHADQRSDSSPRN